MFLIDVCPFAVLTLQRCLVYGVRWSIVSVLRSLFSLFHWLCFWDAYLRLVSPMKTWKRVSLVQRLIILILNLNIYSLYWSVPTKHWIFIFFHPHCNTISEWVLLHILFEKSFCHCVSSPQVYIIFRQIVYCSYLSWRIVIGVIIFSTKPCNFLVEFFLLYGWCPISNKLVLGGIVVNCNFFNFIDRNIARMHDLVYSSVLWDCWSLSLESCFEVHNNTELGKG